MEAEKLNFDVGIVDNVFGKINPKEICIFHGDKKYTYEDLFNRIKTIKLFLSKYPEKSHVGILCENSIEFTSAWFACLYSGMPVVPLNTDSGRDELEYMIKDAEIKILLTSEKLQDEFSIESSSISKIIDEFWEKAKSIEYKPSGVDMDGLAILMYTSGTTSDPVAVKLTHKNIIVNTNSIINYLNLNEKDRVMLILPLYHCYGMSIMHMTFATGGKLVINNKFMFPQKVAEEIVEKKCTEFAGVPATYQILMRMTHIAEMNTKSLRYAYCCAGKLSEKDLLKLKKNLPNTEIILFYGQTEASPRLSYLPFKYYESKLGSIGKGIPDVELKVVNESGQSVEPDKIGEIIARGENVSPGYWKNPERTKETFRDGWLYTGDLARVDRDGFMYIVGRKKDFVKVAGYRFSLAEIEDVTLGMKGIREAAALMVPDDVLGEAVMLFVVPDSKNITPESVIEHYKKSMPSYKVPKEVRIVDEIPKNSFGKIQKRKLLESVDINSCVKCR